MIDRLPKKVNNIENCIINLDREYMPGTHWVCFVKKGRRVKYYDPIGNLRPPPELLKYLGGCDIIYNRGRDQPLNTPYCGHLCLQFLYKNA